MKKYMVGGAVRDSIMGIPVSDVDWVVVGSSVEEMLALGYSQVGADFPVFLHPETQEEHALARQERKTGKGYGGFSVETKGVTLEEDLMRRDLTMNAIAMDYKGNLIDPYGGIKDISKKVIRHVSPSFSEDPLRILRVARFAARYPEFTVAPQTMQLMSLMVANGDIDDLVPERVWVEITKGLSTPKPSRMFEVLRECGALIVILPELDALWGVPQPAEHHPEIDTGIHTMMVLDQATKMGAGLEVKYAALVHDLGKGVTPADVLPRHLGHEGESVKLCEQVATRLKIPKVFAQLAAVVAEEHTNIHRSDQLAYKAVYRLLKRCNAIKKPDQFALVLQACEADARGRLGLEDREYPQVERLQGCLRAALAVDTKAVTSKAIANGLTGIKVGRAVDTARILAIKEFLK